MSAFVRACLPAHAACGILLFELVEDECGVAVHVPADGQDKNATILDAYGCKVRPRHGEGLLTFCVQDAT
jgi:hypothetical protein